ncbi:MAG: hypothetical protein EZS28_009298 [Streblomastix strix]|uniref:Uncharacterized protein n=1 Tax=Streblomastix strix TaxID=222440 RepID=A0A5J4WKV3_9EUKA|nr:MAG: hypothetical protein EZS28_009298 [Streblomastix strix]
MKLPKRNRDRSFQNLIQTGASIATCISDKLSQPAPVANVTYVQEATQKEENVEAQDDYDSDDILDRIAKRVHELQEQRRLDKISLGRMGNFALRMLRCSELEATCERVFALLRRT